jgi:hypothetical protein
MQRGNAICVRRALSKLRYQSAGIDRRLGLGGKHVGWFPVHRLNRRWDAARYYYLLNAQLVARA